MKKSVKIIIALFVVVITLIGIWLSLDSHTKCKLIYGKNICNFYAMMNAQPSISNFDEMMKLCREMNDVPKKDSCFEFIAETFTRINAREEARQACNEIKEFNGVHTKDYCYSKINSIGGAGIQGIVVDVSPSAKTITVFDGAENKEIYLALTDDTKLFDEHRLSVNLSYFRIGFIVEAIGEMTNENSLISSEVYIIEDAANSCVVCINGCDVCPEGCEECLIGIEKKIKDSNMKWYYNPDVP